MRVAELVGNKNWRSAWLILLPDNNSWYAIQRIYWRKVLEKSKEPPIKKPPNNLNARSSQHDGFRLKNEHFYLKTEDKNTLLSSDTWLNHRIICKTLGTQVHYQSDFNCQKRVKPYKAVAQEHVQLLHDANNHWFLSFSKGYVQIGDSLNSNLNQTSKKSIQALYRNFFCDNANVKVTLLPVQKQQDGHNCGLSAVGFAAEILDGKSPIDTVFHVPQLRSHLIYCLENGALAPFPKI